LIDTSGEEYFLGNLTKNAGLALKAGYIKRLNTIVEGFILLNESLFIKQLEFETRKLVNA
jgi:hypothetical protein